MHLERVILIERYFWLAYCRTIRVSTSGLRRLGLLHYGNSAIHVLRAESTGFCYIKQRFPCIWMYRVIPCVVPCVVAT